MQEGVEAGRKRPSTVLQVPREHVMHHPCCNERDQLWLGRQQQPRERDRMFTASRSALAQANKFSLCKTSGG